ncbi:hypothetical protein CYY_001167 [Polysphondylium violaceum]|uniref:Uncharacterized protein n=1 Tax=Polysphondylium violaceum TaxID=133409 RepID=A0A8J4VAV4_9MYCE|nr:hypothetical protein CYY_001167 [Polysphondylium violaceum]
MTSNAQLGIIHTSAPQTTKRDVDGAFWNVWRNNYIRLNLIGNYILQNKLLVFRLTNLLKNYKYYGHLDPFKYNITVKVYIQNESVEQYLSLRSNAIVTAMSFYGSIPIDDRYFSETDNLAHVYFDMYHGQLYSLTLPCSLETLVFGDAFQQPVVALPENLRTLHFGDSYRCSLSADSLPQSLTSLKMSQNEHQRLAGGLFPDSIRELWVSGTLCPETQFPASLETLYIHDLNGDFTKSHFSKATQLKKLVFTSSCVSRIGEDTLPTSLTEIDCDEHLVSFSPGCLPDSLKVLKLNNKTYPEILTPGFIPDFSENVEIACILLNISRYLIPDSVTILHIDCIYEPSGCLIAPFLPSSITKLTYHLTDDYTLPANFFPDSITDLCLVGYYKASVKGLIPDSVETLIIDCDFFSPILPNQLPDSIQQIEFRSTDRNPISQSILPINLKSLYYTPYTNLIYPFRNSIQLIPTSGYFAKPKTKHQLY